MKHDVVLLPNGETIGDVPEGATDAEIKQEAIRMGIATESDFPSAKPELSGMDYVSGLAGQALSGLTANFGDELVAGAMSIPVNLANAPKGESVQDTYNKIRDNIRDRNDQFMQENPGTSIAANVAGGMLPIGMAFKGAQGVSGVARMSGIGAGYGLGDYLGEIDKYSDFEVTEAMKRAGFGASIPLVIGGGKGAIHWLKTREKDEVASVLSELQKNSGEAADISKEAARLGDQASLVDATGDVGVAYGQATQGVGGVTVAKTLEKNLSKVKQAKNRIRTVLQSVTGKGDNQYYGKLEELQSARKINAEKNYGKALNEGSITPTKRMLNIMNTNPLVRESWETVQNQYSRNNKKLPELFNQNADGKIIGAMKDGKLTGTGKKFPNMRAIQELKWEMDAQVALRRGSVDSAGKAEYRRLLNDRTEFMDDVYKQNPLFKRANDAYSGDIAMESAQQLGKKRGLGRGNVEDQIQEINGLTRSEKQAYLQGVMSDVYSGLGRTPDEIMGNINALASRNSEEVLRKLVGTKGAKRVMQEIRSQKRFREVDTKIRQGSQTELRKVATESLKKRNQEINIQDIKKSASKNAIVQKLVSILPNRFGKMDSAQLNELADIMTKPGGVPEALKRMQNAGMNPYEIDAVTKGLSALGVSGVNQEL